MTASINHVLPGHFYCLGACTNLFSFSFWLKNFQREIFLRKVHPTKFEEKKSSLTTTSLALPQHGKPRFTLL
jgi:hypothetical protein